MSFRRTEEAASERALWTTQLLELLPELEHDELVELAASICGTSIAMVTLLDERHQWHRTSNLLKIGDTPREAAFCAHAVRQNGVLLVKDALTDARFGSNPLVTGEPAIRFFAGVALVREDGELMGALSVVDTAPRFLTIEQARALEVLGRQMSLRLSALVQRGVVDQALAEREVATANLRASEELFRAFMNASPFLSYIKDAAGRLLFYNRSFAQRFGVSEYSWLGRTDEQLWSRSRSKSVRTHDLEVMAGGKIVETEEHIRNSDGTISALKSFKFPCHDSVGNVLLAGVAVDVSEEMAHKAELERYHRELEEANDQLRRLAVTDELTGLRNRRSFEERLLMEFSLARRRKRELSVLLLDVDNFKTINDRWGHAAGDEVLRRLGTILRTTVRLPDLPRALRRRGVCRTAPGERRDERDGPCTARHAARGCGGVGQRAGDRQCRNGGDERVSGDRISAR